MALAESVAALPDPGSLITVLELENIVGKLEKGPTPAEAAPGAVSCEYTLASDSSWINIEVFSTDLYTFAAAVRKFGGETPTLVPEFGKDAFVNPDFVDFSAELFVRKRDLVFRVSMPKGPTAVENLKAIARKALARI